MRVAWTNYRGNLAASHENRHDRLDARTSGSPKTLFDLIDGRTLCVSDRQWQIQVFSVRKEAGTTWMQLALAGTSTHTLILKLPLHAGRTHVTCILSSWLLRSAATPQVLAVA